MSRASANLPSRWSASPEDPRRGKDARGCTGRLGLVHALPRDRHGQVQPTLGRADHRFGDQRVELGDQVAILGKLLGIRGGDVGLVELAERGVAHRQPASRERGADRVALLLHERHGLLERLHALPAPAR